MASSNGGVSKDSKGNVDNETVYFVYAGTDKYEPADISTDIYLVPMTLKLKLIQIKF